MGTFSIVSGKKNLFIDICKINPSVQLFNTSLMKSSSNKLWYSQKHLCENIMKEYIQQLTQCKNTMTKKFHLYENRLYCFTVSNGKNLLDREQKWTAHGKNAVVLCYILWNMLIYYFFLFYSQFWINMRTFLPQFWGWAYFYNVLWFLADLSMNVLLI